MIVGCLVGLFYVIPSLSVALGCMVIIKALSYGFNNPVREIVYIPTSDAIKFKAKAWVDMFGNRFSKGGGAGVNAALQNIPNGFATYGILISMSLVGFWVVVALIMGSVFTRLVKTKQVIE